MVVVAACVTLSMKKNKCHAMGYFLKSTISISLSKDKKHELQVMQNDILRICNKSKLSDKISFEHLHIKSKLLSLEQRRERQLLMLMYIHS